MTRATRKSDERRLTESDLASERMGKNSLQGEDQLSVRNERKAMPDERLETDDPIESFRKVDKHKRAVTDLAKGARQKR